MHKKKYKFTHIPTHYQKVKQLDERFLQVKVYVLHTGENYNGSIFEKDVVQNAIPSLANTPILGFVKYTEQDKDFTGHEIDLVIEQGEYKWKYKGQAYGVIPENNNARWEFMTGSDGIEREYLVVDGIIWKKFDDAVDIFTRDMVKGQSMELSDVYSGHFNENDFFVFDQFKFDGCAILGDNVEPAMNSAKVEMNFSMSTLKDNISNMMKDYYSKYSKEGNELNIEELLKQYGLSRQQVIDAGLEIHTYSESDIEKFKEELERIKAELDNKQDNKQDNNQDNKDNQNNQDNKDNNNNNQDNKDNQNQDNQDNKQDNQDNNQDNNFDQKDDDDVKDKKENKQDNQSSNQDNQKDNQKDNRQRDNEKDSKDFQALKEKFEKLEEDYNNLLNDHKELETYKKNREREDHKAKVEALIQSFEKLTDNVVKDIREKVFHFTFEEIEEKLYAILGKKQVTDKEKKKSQFAKFYVANDDKSETKRPYDHLFEKHLKK